eukprot:sb/3467638/
MSFLLSMTLHQKVVFGLLITGILLTHYILSPPSLPPTSLTLHHEAQEPDTGRSILADESPDVLDLLPPTFLPSHASFCWYNSVRKFRCLPSVFVIGMNKCGTTDICDKLTATHPLLEFPSFHKEHEYWARKRLGRSEIHTQEGYGSRELFRSYLDQVGGKRVEGRKDVRLLDGSQAISYDILDWETRHGSEVYYTNANILHSILPSAKIIMILRDPVDRLYSGYYHFNSYRYSGNKTWFGTPEIFHNEVVKEIGRWDRCMRLTRSLHKCCYSSELMAPHQFYSNGHPQM